MVTVSLWGGRWRVNGGEGSNARRHFDLLRDLLRNLPCDCTSQFNLYESADCARSQLDYVDGSASVHEFRNEELDGVSTHCVAHHTDPPGQPGSRSGPPCPYTPPAGGRDRVEIEERIVLGRCNIVGFGPADRQRRRGVAARLPESSRRPIAGAITNPA